MAQLYRKSALERISSPEQLDKTLKLSSPLSWLALLGLTLIVVVVVIWSIVGTIPVTLTAAGVISSPKSTNAIFADESGVVRAISVFRDSEVHLNDPILVYQTGSQTKEILSDQVGYISEILVKNGDAINQGSEIVRISPKTDRQEVDVVVCYVPLDQKHKIRRGMKVQVYLDGLDSQSKGHMIARVINVDARAATNAGLGYVLGSDNNIAGKVAQGPVVAVTCEFYPADTVSGYWWTNDKGADVVVSTGSSITAKIVTEEVAPIEKLFSKIKEIWG